MQYGQKLGVDTTKMKANKSNVSSKEILNAPKKIIASLLKKLSLCVAVWILHNVKWILPI